MSARTVEYHIFLEYRNGAQASYARTGSLDTAQNVVRRVPIHRELIGAFIEEVSTVVSSIGTERWGFNEDGVWTRK